jgi:hypothetical protein
VFMKMGRGNPDALPHLQWRMVIDLWVLY